MNINEMNLEQVRARKAEIRTMLEGGENVDIAALTEETRNLNDRETQLVADVEQRQSLLRNVINTGTVVVEARTDVAHQTTLADQLDRDYRSAFLNNIRGLQLNDAEQRAFSTAAASAGAVVPTVTQNRIIELLEQEAPMLAEIDLMRVAGGISFPVENPISEASKHAENANITASDDKIIKVDLFGFEVVKLLKASKSIMRMSVDAFEDWLVRNLVRSLSRKIKHNIIFGTGTGEATGVDKIVWDDANSVTVAKASTLTSANVLAVIGLLPGVYDAGAKWLMSKKTLLTSFLPLQDKSKNDLVQLVNGVYHVQGYPVMLDDEVLLDEAFLGNFYEGYKGNMPEEVNVVADFSLGSNSYEFLGSAMFDGKPVLKQAFVKIVKGTA